MSTCALVWPRWKVKSGSVSTESRLLAETTGRALSVMYECRACAGWVGEVGS